MVLTKMVNAHTDNRRQPVQQVAVEETSLPTDGAAAKMNSLSRMEIFDSEDNPQLRYRKNTLGNHEHNRLQDTLDAAAADQALPVATMLGQNAPSVHPTPPPVNMPYDVGNAVKAPYSDDIVFLRHDAIPVADACGQTSSEMSSYKLFSQGQGRYAQTPTRVETETLTNYENRTNYHQFSRAMTTMNDDVRAKVEKTQDGFMPKDTQLREGRDPSMVGYQHCARYTPALTETTRNYYAASTYQMGGTGAPRVFDTTHDVDNIQKQALDTRGTAEGDQVQLPVDAYGAINPSLKKAVTYLRSGGKAGALGGRVETAHTPGSSDASQGHTGLASGAAGATERTMSTASESDKSWERPIPVNPQRGMERTSERADNRMGSADAILAREGSTTGIDGASTAVEAYRNEGASDAVSQRESSATSTAETGREDQGFDTLKTETTVSMRGPSGTGAAGQREASLSRTPLVSDAKTNYAGLTTGPAGSRTTAAATRASKQEAAFRTHANGRQSDAGTHRAKQGTLKADGKTHRTSYGQIQAVGTGPLPVVTRQQNHTEQSQAPPRAEFASELKILPVPSVM
jgi:hypothetical protein